MKLRIVAIATSFAYSWLAFGADIPCPSHVAAAPRTQALPAEASRHQSPIVLTQGPALGAPVQVGPASQVSNAGQLPALGKPLTSPRFPKLTDDITFNVPGVQVKPVPEPLSNLHIGFLIRRIGIQRQVDPVEGTKEARSNSIFTVTPSEKRREAFNSACSAAFQDLVTKFELNREELGIPVRYDLGDFVSWYYQTSLTPEVRVKAAPVVDAQRSFEKACLERTIPAEVGATAIQQVVGLLMFEEKVFCSALRVSATEIVTADHCFVDATTGQRSADVEAVLKGEGSMWFTYEGEPEHRYGVCRGSLPPARGSGASYAPASDIARLRIAPTKAPVPQIVRAPTPLTDGTSLYLRGYC